MSIDPVVGRILRQVEATRLSHLVAVTTPIPTSDNRISKKTPIFHLPVYKIELKIESPASSDELSFYCDLPDLSDLIDKLKSMENQWRRFGLNN